MRQAQITKWGEAPQITDVDSPSAPGPEEVRIKVKAVGIHRVVRSRASGQHYSSDSGLPHIPGIDGVGETEDGKLVYWMSFATPAMSEYINVPKASVTELPEGADPVQVAAAVNPAMSSWLGMRTRTVNVPNHFTVLILGATSASGRSAIPLVRSLGAQKVIGVARNEQAMQALDLDERVVIASDPLQTDFSKLGDVDVVLDYVYGPLMVHLLSSLKSTRPTQYVQIGGLDATEVNMPSAILRSSNITLRGSGPGAWSMKEAGRHVSELVKEANKFAKLDVQTFPIEKVNEAWSSQTSGRVAITF